MQYYTTTQLEYDHVQHRPPRLCLLLMNSNLSGCTGGSSRDSRSNSTGSKRSDSAVGIATEPGAAFRQSSMPHCLPGRSRQGSWSGEWCLVRICCSQPFTGTLANCHQFIYSVSQSVPTHSLIYSPALPGQFGIRLGFSLK